MTAPGSFSSGDVLTAADLNAIGVWQDFPAGTGFMNITEGNGTLVQQYVELNELILFSATFQLGSTSALTGGGFQMPFQMADVNASLGFSANISSSAGLGFAAMVRHNTVNACLIRALSATTTYAQQAIISTIVPFVWGSGDRLGISGIYKVA